MHHRPSHTSARPDAPLRWFARPKLLLAVPLLVVLPLFGRGMLSHGGGTSDEEALLCGVSRGLFLNELPARGELDSARNTEVRCEVRSRYGTWVRILDVVEEGTYVQPGDFLIRLDASNLETDRTQQLIVVERSRAAAIAAKTAYESACVAKEEYLNGEYALARQKLDQALQVAENQHKRAKDYLDASRKLFARGYITEQQLEADQFALKTAETDLRSNRTKLRILERITKVKRMADLESAVAVGKVKLASAEFSLERQEEFLADIEEQIEKCVIRAPVAGEVVLAHLYHEGHSHMVEPGELTIQNRVLIRLPDPSNMQVRVKLRETQVAQVQPGMSVRMQLEAFPDVELRGEVVKVNEYPEPPDWFAPSVKEYLAIVSIATPIAGMRPGLTAQLRILVDELPDAVQVATQAVLTHGEQDYCIVATGNGYEARQVTLGSNNGRAVVVESGLAEGERVVLRPTAFLDQVEMP